MITTVSAMPLCAATCDSRVAHAHGERPQRLCWHLLLNRSMMFPQRSIHTSPRSGTASATPSNAKRNWARPFGKHAVTTLTNALLPQAIENDRLVYLAELVMRGCRERRIVAPSVAALERLCADLRHHARREAHRRLTNGLSVEQRKRLDALTQRREEGGQTWLTWLRQMPEAAKPAAMLGVIERLAKVRGIGIEPGRGHLVHQARLAQLAREAGRSTVQHVADYERQRRHATLVAISVDLATSLTDQAIDLFDRLVGALFRKAEGQHARRFPGRCPGNQ